MGVLESVPNSVNFPPDDPLHQGYQWNEKRQNPALAEADTILILDSDVPWIPLINRPAATARILHIDVDPLKEQMPLWYVRATRAWRADAATALRQINAALDTLSVDAAAVRERAARLARRHRRIRAERAKLEEPGAVLTAEYVTAQVREAIGEDALVISEAVTNFHVGDQSRRPSQARDVLRQRRRFAGLERRGGDRCQAGASGRAGVRVHRGWHLHVLHPLERALDRAPLRHAVPAGGVQQPGLACAEVSPCSACIRMALAAAPRSWTSVSSRRRTIPASPQPQAARMRKSCASPSSWRRPCSAPCRPSARGAAP